METPLTPLEFARRARKLYPERVAVIDGDSRWTYAQFLDRCDRWSAALQKLGIKSGDRLAYLSPNTHAQLESFYAVPQIGAVLVPLNYRLTADDFVYLINHSGSRMVCADRDYLGTIDSIREQLPKVEHFVALSCNGGSPQANSAWLDYEGMVNASPAEFS
ncbi:MAG TPA: AMP-binding protein, partial [Pyrinomonadaceae bacterium]|nr:AMP-binding protein [Pyrinomonadaceae bacterium]